MSLTFLLYQAAAWLALFLGWPVVLLRSLRDPRYRTGWGERLGSWGKVGAASGESPVWVHGASLGELRAAAPLIGALRKEGLRLLVTTTSPAGRAAAAELAGPEGSARLLPLDLSLFVGRAFASARPRALLTVETELWPALLRAARKRGVPCLLVNGRVSDRSFPRYARFRRWLGPLFESFREIQAQSKTDAERFTALGAPLDRISVGGNLKFDLPEPDSADAHVRALRRTRAGDWRILVGGSTHPGEEEALLQAARELGERGLRTALVLVPRHLERLSDVESAIRAQGFVPRRWTQLADPLEASILEAFAGGGVLLADTYGLLARLYGAADLAFVGGSLVPVGGHNLLEPLNWGIPVLFGPHMENAREVRDAVLSRRLGEEVGDVHVLTEAAARFLADPARCADVRRRARELFAENRGAAIRALAALRSMGVLPSPSGTGNDS